MKIRITLLILLAGLFINNSNAQDYNLGIGVRLGYNPGLTLKKSLSSNTYFEALLSANSHGFIVTGLWEKQQPFLNEPGFSWFYGVGAHFGAWDQNHNYNNWYTHNDELTIGVDGILGLEYSFVNAPFSLALDWKPAFDVISSPGLRVGNGAFSVRFTF